MRVFIEAVNNTAAELSVRQLGGREKSAGTVVEIATINNFFGLIAIENCPPDLAEETLPLLRNAIMMLAVILEKIKTDELLADENLRLESAVHQRADELLRRMQN